MSKRERIEALEKEVANLKNEIEILKMQIHWTQIPITASPPPNDPKFGYDPFKDQPKTWPQVSLLGNGQRIANPVIDNSKSFTMAMDKYPEMDKPDIFLGAGGAEYRVSDTKDEPTKDTIYTPISIN